MADLTLRAVVEGTAQAQQQFKALSDSVQQVGMSEEERARIEERLQKAAKELQLQEQERIKSTEALRTHTSELVKKFQEQEAANESLGKGHGKLAGNTAFLTREFRALFDELASGRSRMAIGTGTLLITRLTGIGLAGIGAIAAITGVTAVLGYMAVKGEQADRAISAVETRLSAVGQRGLVSRNDIGSMIDSLSGTPGISEEAAQKSVQAIANMHHLTAPLLHDLTSITADMATALGVDAPAAAKALADAFADPEKGAKKLDDQLNFLTADQRVQIETLSRLGDRTEAQGILFSALRDRVQGLGEEGFTPLQRRIKEFEEAMHHAFGATSASGQAGRGVAGAAISWATSFVQYLDLAALGLKKLAEAPLPSKAGLSFGEISPNTTFVQHAPQHERSSEEANHAAMEQEIKDALDAGRAYEGYGLQLERIVGTRRQVSQALYDATVAGETEAADHLFTQLKAINEKIEEMQRAHYKKMQAPQEQAYKEGMDYIREKMRQEEAALKESDQEQAEFAKMQHDRTSALLKQESSDLREKINADAKAQREAVQMQIADIRTSVYWTRDARIKAIEDARDAAIAAYGAESDAVKKLNQELAKQPTEEEENAKKIRQIFGKLTFDTISVFGQIHSTLSTEIGSVLRGTESLGQGVRNVFRGMVNSVIDELARLGANKLLQWLIGADPNTGKVSGSIGGVFGSLGGMIGSLFGGSGGGGGGTDSGIWSGIGAAVGSIIPGVGTFLGSAVGSIFGGLFQTGTDTIVTKPTLFMAGEAGSERLRVDPLHGAAGGGGGRGGVSVHIHGLSMVDNYSARRLAYQIKDLNK